MRILKEIIESVPKDKKIEDFCIGFHLVAVKTKRVGLAATQHWEKGFKKLKIKVPSDTDKVIRWALDKEGIEVSVALATINSLLQVPEKIEYLSGQDLILKKGEGKKVAVIGHFPFVDKIRDRFKNFWVIERIPRPGDLTVSEGKEVLGEADVVAITASTLLNHTLEEILSACKKDSFKILIGPTTPFSKVLFDWGIDALCGAVVEDEEEVFRCINRDLSFRELRGIRKICWTK